MKYLHKIFNEKSRTVFDQEYKMRLNSPTVTKLGLKIKPQDQPNEYELYYLPTNEIIDLITEIFETVQILNYTFYKLPRIARAQFINQCIIEELYHTNDLEGVKSSREEIARSAKEIELKTKRKRRFNSMITSYMQLLNNEVSLPESVNDIRTIYDLITDGEIEDKDKPDGEIFRLEETFVHKKSGTGKIIHTGLTPESKIRIEMDNLLKFMNKSEVPELIKVAVGHYFYGYIHPFYDGNGRTSRFLSSLYLSKIVGDIGALSLSRAANKFSNKYLEAFEVTNSIKNNGEMNYFIESLLTVILSALKEMATEIKEKDELLRLAIEKIREEPELKNKKDRFRKVMFTIAQHYFFSVESSKGVTVKELAKVHSVSPATIRATVKKLEELSLIDQTGQKPVYIKIKKGYFES